MLHAVALALRARLRELMWLREIFLIAPPPLLIQGGEFTFSDRFGALYPGLRLGLYYAAATRL
jgi:hypothetical protein